MSAPLESDILALFERAKQDVLIVAPFIRSEALVRLLDSIPSGVETNIVTRWRIEDFLAGASDLDVYNLAEAKEIPIYLRADLHAKLFAADATCLVGSANVTGTALGWRTQSNLELLVPVSRGTESVSRFEKQLFDRTVLATTGQRDLYAKLLERFHESKASIREAVDRSSKLLPSDWFPQARNPEELFLAYQGEQDFSYPALTMMREELRKIDPVANLDEEEFRLLIAIKITQTPLVVEVMQRIERHGQVSEAEIRDVLIDIGVEASSYQPRNVLEALERWFTYFLSVRYETVRESVRLIKAKEL